MEDRVIKRAVGFNGTLELLEDHIRIRRDGWTSRIYGRRHHEERLSLGLIEKVDFVKTAGGLAGYIAFNGGTDPDCIEDLCVSFVLPQQHAFEEILAAIEDERGRFRVSPTYLKSAEFVIDNQL